MKYLSVLILVLLAASFAFAQSPEAQIRTLTGTVELKTPGSASWALAKAGDRLESSTLISTGFKSTAILLIGSSTLTVRPLTRLSLDELISREGIETINVGLRAGRMQVSVKPPAGSRTDFTVSTTVATASVRGTEFYVDPFNLRVIEGTVIYAPAGKTGGRPTLVGAGQKTYVDTDTGKSIPPMKAAEAGRGLPALPGQSAAPSANDSGPGAGAAMGNLEMDDIILVPQSETGI